MLAHRPNPRCGDTSVEQVSLEGASVPSDAEAQEIIAHFDLGIDKLHVLVARKEQRRTSCHLVTHCVSAKFPEGSFISLEHWDRNTALYVCCPELAYLQACCCSAREAIYAGFAMTSDYRLDDLARSGVVARADSGLDARLTTVEQIAVYLEQAEGLRGRAKATSYLKYVLEGSRSPRETALGMMLSLPACYGGYALGLVELNKTYRIRDGKNRRGTARIITRTPDVVVSAVPEWGPGVSLRNANVGRVKRYVAFDYDSDAEHADTTKMQRDVERRNELALLDDVAHFTVTTEIMNDYASCTDVIDRARRKLRVRRRPLFNKTYSSEQRHLKVREVENKQFELWRFLVEEKRSW